MVDSFSKKVRSRIMSKIRGKDTGPELKLRKLLFSRGYRYRKNYRIGRKTIDIAFITKKIAVLIDGCFWHGCPKCYKKPKSNVTYWDQKINSNIRRDKITNLNLKTDGWRVIRIWEHSIRNNDAGCADKVSKSLG